MIGTSDAVQGYKYTIVLKINVFFPGQFIKFNVQRQILKKLTVKCHRNCKES